ncbi:hypothetical protein WMF26_32365 [Sorangium sp. So ce185]|uniref:hypothetical protein n=1 Tax=Sorangium sp. So ce185 TaxID=3133287 RepID=UPI003F60D8FE
MVTLARPGGPILASRTWQFPLGGIQAGAKHLYWLDGISVANVRVGPKDDIGRTSATVSLNTPVGDVRASAAAGDTLLVLTSGGLLGLSPTDAAPRLVAAELSGWALATDGRSAVWTTGVAGSDQGSVKRGDLTSGAVSEVVGGETRPGAVTFDGGGIYWVSFGAGPDGAIRGLPAGASSPITLAAGQPAPRAIAVDRDAVYWVNDAPDGRHLRSVPRRGGPVRELLHRPAPQGSTGQERLVVAGDDAYFIVAGQIEHALTSGAPGASVIKARPPGRVVSFDVDERHLYLTVDVPAPAPPARRRGPP